MDELKQPGGYVFVVCGSSEHLDTLKLSYETLSKKTKYPVYVVTDNSRNEYILDYPLLKNIETPKNYNHHQASIWLKTGLFKYFDDHKVYVYLDTDILTYGNHPDNIFKQYTAPISFAADHCEMPQFSPYAINCGCSEMFENKREEVKKIIGKYDPVSLVDDQKIIEKRNQLFSAFQQAKSNGRLPVSFYLRYIFSWPVFHISENFKLDKRKKIWYDALGNEIMHKVNMRKVAHHAHLKWNYLRNEMTLKDGRNLWSNYCNHLQDAIKETFRITVSKNNFQHWNGGVFLFSNESKEFLSNWHSFTLNIFDNKNWKTRDQGTLIATIWKFNLHDHPVLNIKWNMILDYYYPNLKISEDHKITINGNDYIEPEFVHVYHHWGDTKWDVWNRVMEKINA